MIPKDNHLYLKKIIKALLEVRIQKICHLNQIRNKMNNLLKCKKNLTIL